MGIRDRCVGERERERERVCARVCVRACEVKRVQEEERGGKRRRDRSRERVKVFQAVSYTPMTLPTKIRVWNSMAAT